MAKYVVTAPDGTELELTGPEGADMETVIAKGKEIWAKMQEQTAGIPEGGIPVAQRRGGGPGFKQEAYQQSGLMQFNEDEEAAIKAAAGGDPQKEYFLRLVPTIEWRNNPKGMRSKQASPAGALGPYQFMPATASTFGVGNRLDFGHSVEGAAKYYDYLNKQYGGNFKAMLADYNGGPTQAKAVMNGEEPPAAETREYLQLADKYSKSYAVDTTRRAFTTEAVPQAAQGGGEAAPAEVPEQEYTKAQMTAGAADVAATIGSGIVGTIGGGLAGLGTLVFTGDAERASEVVKGVSDFVTWSPKSKVGKEFFSVLSPVLEQVDNKVKDASMAVGGGNPLAATAVETAGNAVLMLIGPGAVKASVSAGLAAGKSSGVRAGLTAAGKEVVAKSTLGQVHTAEKARAAQQAAIDAEAHRLTKFAEQLGVKLNLKEIRSSVREMAERQGGAGRGAGLDDIAAKLSAKHLEAKAAANQKWVDFRNQPHYTNVEWADGMVRPLAEELAADGINIADDAIQASLKDIAGLRTQRRTVLDPDTLAFEQAPVQTGFQLNPATKVLEKVDVQTQYKTQTLNEIQAVRKQIQSRIDDAQGSTKKGLGVIGKRLDDMLDAQFRADAAKGMEAPYKAWKDARDTWRQYAENWNENVAAQRILTDPNMTPQKLAQEILGTSSLLGGKQSSRIYEHIMKLTGNDPEFRFAVEKSVMYDLLKPLIDNPEPSTGHFRAVANNIKRLRKENPQLIDAMWPSAKNAKRRRGDDLMKSLQHAARVAEHAQFGEAIGLFDTVKQAIIRHAVGHEIAQAGFRVRLAEKLVNILFQRDKTTHADMIREFGGIAGEPLTAKIARDELGKAVLRGELANQYQNFGEWGDTY